MIRVMLVHLSGTGLASMIIASEDVQVIETASAEQALEHARHGNYDLAIVGESVEGMSGFTVAEKLVTANPMLNIALAGDLPEAEFHEASEGLGVLKQINPTPSPEAVSELLGILRRILGQIEGNPR